MPVIYNILHSFKDIHAVVLKLAESLDDDQLGIMECLQGLQTGFGSATEERK